MEESTAPLKRPTIRDVASAAGVSRGTVSRVINGGHWVSPDARAAVEHAIESTGYLVNQHARSLATGRSNSFAFLLTEPQHLLFDDPTFSLLLRGAAEALSRRHKTLVLLVAGTDEERHNVSNYVRAGHVDGVLLISSHAQDPMLDTLVNTNVPVVSCGIPLNHQDDITYVSIDESGSAQVITRHLRERGHRRIAMITGPSDTPGGRYRLTGFQEEMGADFDASLVEEGDYSHESGLRAMNAILDRSPDIDAVFAASDRMAAGAMASIKKRGKTIPDDIAVAGFDDSGLAARLDPPLTTMRQPFETISEEMVSRLIHLTAGSSAESITLPATLVVRETT